MEQKQALVSIEERVRADLSQISTKLPEFEELSEDEQEKVRNHMNMLDENDIRSINTYGKQVYDKSSEEEDAYLKTIKNGEIEIGEIQTELLQAFEQTKPNTNIVSKILSIGKKKVQKELDMQKTISATTDLITEKTEKLRNELEQHYYRLQQMSTRSVQERHEIELLIVAAKEKYEQIKEEIEEIEAKPEKTFDEIQRQSNLKAYLNKLVRKIQGDETRLITTTTRAITSNYLAQGLDEMAFCFEQDVELAKPELRATAIFSSSRQVVTGAVQTYEKFQDGINSMLREETKKSVETLNRINEMQKLPLIDKQTLKELLANTLEASKLVREYHEKQKQIPTMGSEYESMYQDFTKELQKIVSTSNEQKIEQMSNGQVAGERER